MLRKHIAVDLGTANTLVFVQSQGIVINEPSVVAVDTINERVIAVGKEAKDYIGKTPQRISTIRPLRDGVIADFDAAQALIATFLKKVIGSWPIKPDVVICVPTNITDVERRAVAEAATKAGARNVKLIEEPVAAAVGAGLPVLDPVGSMVVDIGGGTTDIAVITLGSMACSTSLKLAGDALTAAVSVLSRKNTRLSWAKTWLNVSKSPSAPSRPFPYRCHSKSRARISQPRAPGLLPFPIRILVRHFNPSPKSLSARSWGYWKSLRPNWGPTSCAKACC